MRIKNRLNIQHSTFNVQRPAARGLRPRALILHFSIFIFQFSIPPFIPRVALPLTLALACLWPALSRADRESDFEDGLRQRGYYELLEVYYQDKMAGPGLSAKDKADLASNLSSLYMSMAEAKSDLPDKERFWQKASDILRRHVPEGSKDATALRMRIGQGAMELDKARVLAGSLPPEPDAKPKPEAAAAFESAIATFKSVRDDAYGVLQTQGVAEKESRLAEAVAVEGEYRLAWSRYYFALAHGAKATERAELLKSALQAFQVIGSTYDDIEAGYDCILGTGLCHRDLGANTQALKSLDEALDKAKTPHIRLSAYYNKAVTLYNMGRHEDAAKAAETARKIRLSEPSALEVIHAAHLLQARAYHAMSEFKRGEEQKKLVAKAVETAKELTDVGGKWSAAAFDLIASWGGQEQRGDSFGHFAKAESLFRQGKYQEAVPALQDFLKLPADPKHAALIPEATFRLAVCHYQLKQYPEAAEGFSKVVREHKQTPLGARSAYWASLAAERRYAETKSKDDQKRYMQSLRFLMDTYPNTKEAADAQILVASLLQEQGDFVAAAREYEKIPKGSESYQDALYGAGLCYQKLLYKAWESSSATAAGDVSKLLTSTIEKFRLAGMSSPGSAEGDERIARGKKLAAASDLALATLYLNDNV
ncbi:MAG: tetratricopeptide repeat protein, partial [Planctomycetes bacterium]|nr:tetratricopeptide repeat protein [Planctomycetota bacterium]